MSPPTLLRRSTCAGGSGDGVGVADDGDEHRRRRALRDGDREGRVRQPRLRRAVRFSVAGANMRLGRGHDERQRRGQVLLHGHQAPATTRSAFYADTDGNEQKGDGEPSGTTSKTYQAGAARARSPRRRATNKAGEQHCVTATVTDQVRQPGLRGDGAVLGLGG